MSTCHQIYRFFFLRASLTFVTFLRTVLNEEQKHEFEELVAYFKDNVDPLSKDLAFLLGEM